MYFIVFYSDFLDLIVDMKIKFYGSLDLDKTLDCGQCFRWFKKDRIWNGIVDGRQVSVSLEGSNILNIESDICDVSFWSEYFDLDTDYVKITKSLIDLDPILCKAVSENMGVRILKQEPWEVLCSFIISQNNNIKRIKRIIGRICKNFGSCSDGVYSFPSVEKIASLSIDDLDIIKSGFRSKYILDAAKCIVDEKVKFSDIYNSDVVYSEQILRKINGVGPKVARCVLLFGFHKLDSFPIDTWMNKVLSQFYSDKTVEYFGKYAGVAQQYLFMWSRNNKNIFD